MQAHRTDRLLPNLEQLDHATKCVTAGPLDEAPLVRVAEIQQSFSGPCKEECLNFRLPAEKCI
jgi:hypothetical protein